MQILNIPALRCIGDILSKPALLIPQFIVKDVGDVDVNRLGRCGVRAVAFDKDNCITAPYSSIVHPPFKGRLDEFRRVFDGRICVVSNSAGSSDDPDHSRAKELEKGLEFPVLSHGTKKPAGAEYLLAHFPSTTAQQIAVIGDRLFTDVVYANRISAVSILAWDIITAEGDNRVAAWIRDYEHQYIYSRRHMLPDNVYSLSRSGWSI